MQSLLHRAMNIITLSEAIKLLFIKSQQRAGAGLFGIWTYTFNQIWCCRKNITHKKFYSEFPRTELVNEKWYQIYVYHFEQG